MDMKKQTGDHMKETVLLYGFKDQERLKKVKRALLPLYSGSVVKTKI